MLKKIFSIFIISINIFLILSEDTFANSQKFQVKERFIENNYKYTHYFKSKQDLVQYKKSIIIDTKNSNIKAFFYGQEIWSFDASVGNWYNPTPKGRFRIVNKHPMMKAQGSGLYMPNWMEFWGKGRFGIHGFPLYKDFSPKYPNEQEFSRTPLAGGCVRIEEENLKALYNWSELLTTVIVL